ncbi:glycosyl-4,4'-diaponeurosporenoate acyltransferase CrtO family protein [Nonlabens antarcticus]|uniref:glycosyl-4,4'-diaponeurosporenoate acyltransferase CrtO family protein n=1 Tax=Nonlabens antarcticus TaxID=392714 RepID=UPI0037432D93
MVSLHHFIFNWRLHSLPAIPKILPVRWDYFCGRNKFYFDGLVCCYHATFKIFLSIILFQYKHIEQQGSIYKYLGVGLCRKLLVIIGWEKMTNYMNPSIKFNPESLKQRELNTRAGEFSHLIIATIIAIMILILPISITEAKWLIASIILFHIYPIFIQRYNRPRYLNLIRKYENRVRI